MPQDYGDTTELNRELLAYGEEDKKNRADYPISSTFNDLEVFRYPENIASPNNLEYPHYAMFYITIRESDIGEGEVVNNRLTEAINIEISNSNRPDRLRGGATILGTLIGGEGGARAGGEIAEGVSSSVEAVTGLQSLGESAQKTIQPYLAGGIGTAAAVTLTAQATARERRTLTTAIALYINDVPSVSYKADFDTKDVGALGSLGNILGGFQQAIKGENAAGDELSTGERIEALKSSFANLGGAAGSLALKNANEGVLGALGDAGALYSTSTGIAANPFQVQAFQNMGFRKFNFNYVFLPKSGSEYMQVVAIIKAFKKYMHPKLGTEQALMGYPAEFGIEFYHKDNPNYNLFRIGNSYLTDMSVSYGGKDFVTFKGTDGMPAEINMKLSFTELEVLSRERIEAGY